MHPELPTDPDAGPRRSPASVLLVAAGGIAGTGVRYGFARLDPTAQNTWPWDTFVVNMAGALILGALLEALARHGPDTGARLHLRLLLGTGFCGALTTYSTLAVETDLLARSHCTGLAVAYPVVSVVAGTAACFAGIWLAARDRT